VIGENTINNPSLTYQIFSTQMSLIINLLIKLETPQLFRWLLVASLAKNVLLIAFCPMGVPT